MDVITPLVLTRRGTNFGGTSALAIPRLNLTGLRLFGQAAFVHKPSNAFGLVFSNGVEMLIGSPNQTPSRAIGAYDSNAATGAFAVRTNANRNPGGIVVQWRGTFN